MIVPHTPLARTALAALMGIGLFGNQACGEKLEISPAKSNPISKMARVISPQLVRVEDRLAWLDRQVFSLAKYHQFSLSYNIGYRGHRLTADSPDPTIVMDLGASMPVDRVYLVPAQREYLSDTGIFPKRFTIELAESGDFSDSVIIHDPDTLVTMQDGGNPVAFNARHNGRYLRLTVHQGHLKGSRDVFGLSEIFVFSDRQPVSFNATITTTGDLNIDNVWTPGALIDGRTPLGIWHQGEKTGKVAGDAVIINKANSNTRWHIPLSGEHPIDQIILYPYQLRGSYDISIIPQSLRIEVIKPGQSKPVFTRVWSNPLPGTNQLTPLVFPMMGVNAGELTITATAPWNMGHRKMHAFSEIEVWSEGKNLINGQTLIRSHERKEVEVRSLTDGFSSEKRLSSIDSWLQQLIQRGQIQEEIKSLRSIHSQLATRSELNVSWGAAVLLGLTFLVPVFIFERKRMRSKEHLDIIRKRIAADLHDDIGSNLGSISLIARTARKELAKISGADEIDNDLGEVETIARESSLAMRDIVWLLERRQDSIGDLVHRMRETAGRLLRGTDFSLECSSTKTAAKLTLDAKRHLFLFYKEAIHNIVKHSEADLISIRLWDEGELLGMEIIDNGVGLPVNRDRVSVSVKKLEERAEVLGGTLQITSSAETGTCLRLLVKRIKLTTASKSS